MALIRFLQEYDAYVIRPPGASDPYAVGNRTYVPTGAPTSNWRWRHVEAHPLHHDKPAGAPAAAWDNVRLALVTPCNDPRFDADGDVDSTDVTAFEACASGPEVPANASCDDGQPIP